jgi:hypothetical protein
MFASCSRARVRSREHLLVSEQRRRSTRRSKASIDVGNLAEVAIHTLIEPGREGKSYPITRTRLSVVFSGARNGSVARSDPRPNAAEQPRGEREVLAKR